MQSIVPPGATWDLIRGRGGRIRLASECLDTEHTSGKLHKDYTVYEDVKSILPIYIHVYPVRPCRDDLCEIIPSIWGAVARYDRSDLFIIACGQSHLFMNMLWSAMISCELSYHVATVLLVSCGSVFPHKNPEINLSSKGIFNISVYEKLSGRGQTGEKTQRIYINLKNWITFILLAISSSLLSCWTH